MEFNETQRFNNTWHYILFMTIICLVVGTVAFNYFFMKSETNSIIGGISSLIVLCILWFSMQLKTRVDAIGIHYRYSPFHFKERTITWSEINTIEIKEYRPFQDYGGWGIRFKGFDFNNILLNVSGNKGIYIVHKSGKKYLIGTQIPLEAEKAIEANKPT